MIASSHRKSRTRVMIVDPEWHVGLMLADCLASSGYHAVLGRNLESMLHDLREMQPTAIVLNAHPRQSGQSSLEAVKACCPNAPVISLGQPDHAVGEPTLCTGGSRAERTYVTPHHIEELLQTKFGIPCARLG